MKVCNPSRVSLLSLIAALAMLTPAWTFAGTDTSGGGKAVVCEDKASGTRRVTLLDLYQAVHPGGLALLQTKGTFDEVYTSYLTLLNSLLGDTTPIGAKDLTEIHDYMKQFYSFLPAGSSLPPLPDSGPTYALPKNCEIQQLAIFHDDTNKIEINTDLWNSLDSLNQVAIYAREFTYRLFLSSGEATSYNARRVITQLFTTTPPGFIYDGVPTKGLFCTAGAGSKDQDSTSSFFVYDDPMVPGGSILQFGNIQGLPVFSPTRVQVPFKIDLKNLKSTTTDGATSLSVTDPAMKFSQFQIVEGSIFTSFSVQIQYQSGKPFALTLYNAEQAVGPQTLVNACSAVDDKK